MELSYLGATSTIRDLPGGYGAGTWLGGFLFIIKFNGICLRPSIPRPNGNTAIQLKYIDDASKAASINLKKSLIPDTQVRPQPLNLYEASGKIIDPQENVLQHELDRFQIETTKNNFVTNKKKTMVMVFNNAKNYTFNPEFRMGDSETLSVKKELKILGVMVQNDLKWDSQVKQMVGKASAKIWLLRRMKLMGVDENTITEYWKSEGLVHLEYCVPLWAGGINIGQANDLQRTQMRAVAAITGGREDYTMACRFTDLPATDTLENETIWQHALWHYDNLGSTTAWQWTYWQHNILAKDTLVAQHFGSTTFRQHNIAALLLPLAPRHFNTTTLWHSSHFSTTTFWQDNF